MASQFPPSDLCFELPAVPAIDDICLPGGICLSYVWDGINKIPHAADLPIAFYQQIGPALTPLVPMFNILDTVLAIYRCVKAIPDAITSLDPSELLNCIPALAKLIDQLLKLIPQMSIPKMIKQALRNIASLLRAIAADFQYIESQFQLIADQIDRAAELSDQKMNGFLVCAQADLNTEVASTSQALKGIGRIVLLINVFMGMIGGQEIPCFGSIIDDNIGEGFDVVVDVLTKLADILDEMASVIPDPDMVLTLALAGQKC